MKNNSFRHHAHEFVDWIADYFENIEKYPVKSQVSPGDIKKQIPPQLLKRRGYEYYFQGFSENHHAGHQPLAASGLVCLFSGQ